MDPRRRDETLGIELFPDRGGYDVFSFPQRLRCRLAQTGAGI